MLQMIRGQAYDSTQPVNYGGGILIESVIDPATLLKAAPVTLTSTPGGELVSMPGMALAMADAEAQAREREKARWAEACERERLRGAAEVERIRAEGKARYMAVVRSLEARCVSEFEAHMTEIGAKKEAAAGEARALEARLRELRASVTSAKAEKGRLEAESGRLRQAAGLEAEGKRARLADLQAGALEKAAAESGEGAPEEFSFKSAGATQASALAGALAAKIRENVKLLSVTSVGPSAALRSMLDQFGALGILTAGEVAALKAIALEPAALSEMDVRRAIYADNGDLLI
jgi:hypothetical protein